MDQRNRVGGRERRAGDLYRFFNEDGEVIYIGSSTRTVIHRMNEHRYERPWWDEVATITVEKVPFRRLRSAEMEAIDAEQPKYNVLWGIHRATGVNTQGSIPWSSK